MRSLRCRGHAVTMAAQVGKLASSLRWFRRTAERLIRSLRSLPPEGIAASRGSAGENTNAAQPSPEAVFLIPKTPDRGKSPAIIALKFVLSSPEELHISAKPGRRTRDVFTVFFMLIQPFLFIFLIPFSFTQHFPPAVQNKTQTVLSNEDQKTICVHSSAGKALWARTGLMHPANYIRRLWVSIA